MFPKYYQDELEFLREMGREFGKDNPDAAGSLVERGADPDVERLLEGFAFMVGRLRQKLDDELPELTQSMLQMIWPHYLRPLPAMTIVQFEPDPKVLREPQPIPRGTEVASVPIEGTPCLFRTTQEIRLLPLELHSAAVETPAGQKGFLKIGLRIVSGAKLEALEIDRLPLHLHGEPATCFALHLLLTRGLERIVLRRGTDEAGAPAVSFPCTGLESGGFDPAESLLPYPPHAFAGYRLLQEYFSLPERFLSLTLSGLERLTQLGIEDEFEILFEFAEALESDLRVSANNIRLHCSPVVNLFSVQSDPIRIEHERTEYQIRPSGRDVSHGEVFSVDRVMGWARGTASERDLPAFESFRYDAGPQSDSGVVYYLLRRKESVVDEGIDTYVSFVTGQQQKAMPPTETVVADLTCTNRSLPNELRVNDVSCPTAQTPRFATFKNISRVTPAVAPPLGGDLHWRLISNLYLNYLSLTDVDQLRSVLSIYNFPALHDRPAARKNKLRLEGILKIGAFPDVHFFRGTPVRGQRIELDMQEDNFAGEGEMVLFASILKEFFALYCTLNSHVRLVVRGAQHGERYEWPPQAGHQTLI